jgi:phosphoglycolate phosphatase
MRRADTVLFDLDGVLVDSRVSFARSVNAALVAHNLPVREETELHAFLGPPLHGTFAELGAGDAVQSCVEAYRRRYLAESASETTLFPGITQALDELGRRCSLVVATSKAQALAEPLLTALGVRHHFVAVVGPDLTAEQETKDVTIRRALRVLPSCGHAVMVGDRHYDIVGARANGLASIGVLWGIGDEDELKCAGADALAREPEDLLRLL